MSWTQGSLLEVTITDLATGGDGVARWENRVIFVPNTVPGDHVQVRLVRVKSREAFGQVETLRSPSPDRIRPRCIVADKCGGCQWQVVDYARQVEAKQKAVEQALGVAVRPLWQAPDPFHYRNKVTYPLGYTQSGAIALGYYAQGSHRVININQCPVEDQRLDSLLAPIKQSLHWSIYDETKQTGLLRHLGLRVGRRTGEILVTLVATDRPPGIETWAADLMSRFPRIVGVAWNYNPKPGNVIFSNQTEILRGCGYVRELFCGLLFHIGPTTFFQIYTEQAERLVEHVVREAQLTGRETVVDAYSGIGTMALPLARHAQTVIGIELWGESVHQAQANAQRNGLTNTQFIQGAVEDWLPKQKVAADVLCLDPPRKGCDPAVLKALLDHPPRRILYVSCNPVTLARDLRVLCEGGYTLQSAQPVDFFPQTYHVECLAVLTKG